MSGLVSNHSEQKVCRTYIHTGVLTVSFKHILINQTNVRYKQESVRIHVLYETSYTPYGSL